MQVTGLVLFSLALWAGQVEGPIEDRLAEGNRLLLADDLAQATVVLDSVLADAHANSAQRAQALVSLSTIALFRYDLETMRERAEAALRLVVENDELALYHADALRMLDSYYGERGDYEKALAIAEEEIQLRRTKVPGQAKLERALIGKAITQAQLGLLRRAELTILEAYEVARANDPGGHVTEELIRVNHGYILSLRKQFKEAQKLYAGSVAYRRQHQPNSSRMANALANLSEVELALGDWSAASENVSEGLEIIVGAAPGSRVHSDLLRLRAKVEAASGEPIAALRSLREAVALYRAASPDSAEMLVPLIELGWALFDQDEIPEAQKAFEEARTIGQRHVPQTGNFARVLHGLAAVTRAQQNVAESMQLLRQAVAALDFQFAMVGASAEDIADYASEYREIHEDLAIGQLESGDTFAALDTLDQFRERVLLERIHARRNFRNTYTQNAELELLEQTQQKLLQQIADTSDESQRAALELKLGQTRRTLSLKAVELGAERGFSTQLDDSALTRAREHLRADSAIITFSRIRSDYHRFILTKDGIYHDKVGTAEEIAGQASVLRALLEAEAPKQSYAAVLDGLSQSLLRTDSLDWHRTKRVLIVGDGELQVIPFSALPVPGVDQPLVATSEVAYSNSIAAWVSQTGGAQRPKQDFVGYAYAAAGSGLRHVEAEVQQAATVLQGQSNVSLGEEATETLAKSRSGGILHFAAHAELDAQDAYQSYVQLATSERDDGFLEVFEIMNVEAFQADLVVLSACDTVLGPTLAGEGVLGLAKAFAYAGSPRVVASLWRLEDESTALLMRSFYRYLSEGADVTSALRGAQLDLLRGEAGSFWWRLTNRAQAERFRHPRYWAGFALIGAF